MEIRKYKMENRKTKSGPAWKGCPFRSGKKERKIKNRTLKKEPVKKASEFLSCKIGSLP
jgi:hypothetical protein